MKVCLLGIFIFCLSLIAFTLGCFSRANKSLFHSLRKAQYCNKKNNHISQDMYHLKNQDYNMIDYSCLEKKRIFVYAEKGLRLPFENSWFTKSLVEKANELIFNEVNSCYPNEKELRRLYGLYLVKGFLAINYGSGKISSSCIVAPHDIFCEPNHNTLHTLHAILAGNDFVVLFSKSSKFAKTGVIDAQCWLTQ